MPIPHKLGTVYTPSKLASWVADLLLAELHQHDTVILDPACGDGALLQAVHAHQRPALQLHGIDIDPAAVQATGTRLGAHVQLQLGDALQQLRSPTPTSPRPHGIIANPPWGADTLLPPSQLRALGYSLAKGNVESSDLFIEACLDRVRPSGVLALIIPDSLFLPDHKRLRQLLLERSRLLLLARLGEGFFPGIFRGTVVLVARRGAAPPGHQVRCFRLDKGWRSRILEDQATLSQADAALSHHVPQARFRGDDQQRYDIDLEQKDVAVVARIQEQPMPWSRWLVTRRGAEISKLGTVARCPVCGWASPLPRHPRTVACTDCGQSYGSHDAPAKPIVRPLSPTNERGWVPLIVGEDVDRHRCSPTRALQLDVPGINYKPAQWYRETKLLVRKTGLGIKAAIDADGCWTTQVVYHFVPAPGTQPPPFLLHYLQGVLGSRTLLAWHLVRQGENEWRSHPYLTQKTIQQLPIPLPRPDTQGWQQAQAIAAQVQKLGPRPTPGGSADVALEQLVAGMYGLDSGDCAWVQSVLERAQQLQPIRTLVLTEPAHLKPRLV